MGDLFQDVLRSTVHPTKGDERATRVMDAAVTQADGHQVPLPVLPEGYSRFAVSTGIEEGDRQDAGFGQSLGCQA
jgi:hypothetical protein